MTEITKDFIKLIAGLVVVLAVFSVILAPKGVLSNVFTFKTYAEPLTLLDHLAATVATAGSCPGECSLSFKTSGMPYILDIYKKGENYFASIDFSLVEQKTNVKYENVEPRELVSECEIREQNLTFLDGIIQDVTVRKIIEGDSCEIFIESNKEEYDFNVSVYPDTLFLMNNSRTEAVVTVSLVKGTVAPGPVKLMTSGEPDGVDIVFEQNSVKPTFTSRMIISAAPTTKPGTYNITIEALSGSLMRTAELKLEVSPDFYTFILDSKVYIISWPLTGVKVNVSNDTRNTRPFNALISNIVYGLIPRLAYYVKVDNPFNSRPFSHFRDYDCDSLGNISDSSINPYPFNIINKTRSITAYYKTFTQIRNLEYDNVTKIISGNLLDEDFNPIINKTTAYYTCGVSTDVYPNRNITIQYLDTCNNTWLNISSIRSSLASAPKFYDNFSSNDYDKWTTIPTWSVISGELSNTGTGDETAQTKWNYWNGSYGENNNLETSVKILSGNNVSIRIFDAINDYYLQTNNSYGNIYLWVNGALAQSVSLTGINPSQWNTWRIKQNESYMEFYLNNIKLIRYNGVPLMNFGRVMFRTLNTKAAFDNVTVYDGSWSYNFSSTPCSVKKIRAAYISSDWYYNDSFADIDIDPTTIPCKLTVNTQVDVPSTPLPGVVVNVTDGITNTKYTKTTAGPLATAVYFLASSFLPVHNITVNDTFILRNFSHYWDQDCDPANNGYYLDAANNPYWFSMCRDKNITVLYKTFTMMTNSSGASNTFNFDFRVSPIISGKLLDENSRPIVNKNGTKHSVCTAPSVYDNITINRNVTLEYFKKDTWYYINATDSLADGSWSMNWGCVCNATKLRANYTPIAANWYYMPNSTVMDIVCPCKLTVLAETDALSAVFVSPLWPVRVNVSNRINWTDANGYTVYYLFPGNYYINVDDPFNSRPFSHFFDSDCNPAAMSCWLDNASNPYTFGIYDRDKNITAQYKAFTNITDIKGNTNTFEYNGTAIKGKLTDERGSALVDHGNKHPKCEVSTTTPTRVTVNRNVSLDYYNSSDGRWHNINNVTVDPSDNVSWSYNWNWIPGASKIRASYTPVPENWYYNYTSAEISLSKLTVFTRLDLNNNPPISNVNVTYNGNTKATDASGKVEFLLNSVSNVIKVDNPFSDPLGSRNFSHFWDSDCDSLGNYSDVIGLPFGTYSFTSWNKDRNITAYYRTFTNITNTSGSANTFEYNGAVVRGKLIDEKGSIIRPIDGSYHPACGPSTSLVPINRNVFLDYYVNGSWYSLGANNSSTIDGSWSYNWVCSCNTTKIRATYNSLNWYYNSTGTEINIDPSLCPCKLTVFAFKDIPNLPIPNVQIDLDSLPSQFTDALGKTEFMIRPGNHVVTANIPSNAFSHFWDSDCSQASSGWYCDNSSNPFSFVIYPRDRNITAYYKVLTNITNPAGTKNTFDFDGTFIKGKLLDENSRPIVNKNGTKHSVCTAPSVYDNITINRNVTLESYNITDSKWYLLGVNDSSTVDGSWSYAWSCSPGTTQLRANYTPTVGNWYYVGTSAVIPVACAGALEVHSFVGISEVVSKVAIGFGDVNWDDAVNSTDLWYFDSGNPNSCFGSNIGEPAWNLDCDMNLDNAINVLDVSVVGSQQGKSTPIYITPFTTAMNLGTYQLRAKYDNQIKNNNSVVINAGQTTRVNFTFLTCDGFTALNCSVPFAGTGNFRNLTGSCGRVGPAYAQVDCNGTYRSQTFCNTSAVPGPLCENAEPLINTYTVSTTNMFLGDSFSVNVNGICPASLPGKCLIECRVVQPNNSLIELDVWNKPTAASPITTTPFVKCDQLGDYIVDYCAVATDFWDNRGWNSLNHTNTTIKCAPNCNLFNGGYADTFSTAPSLQCPGYDYGSFASANQMRDYYLSGSNCVCKVTYDSSIRLLEAYTGLGWSAGGDVNVQKNQWINTSVVLNNTGNSTQNNWLVSVDFYNVSDYNSPGATRDVNTYVNASYSRTSGSSCRNAAGLVIPGCACSYSDQNGNGIWEPAEYMWLYCWMNSSYWPETPGNRRIMLWSNELDTSKDANNNGVTGEWGNDDMSRKGGLSTDVRVNVTPPSTNCNLFDGGYDDTFNTAPSLQCPSYNYGSFTSASQMRDYYLSGTNCVCDATYDSYIMRNCVYNAGVWSCAGDIKVVNNQYINVSTLVNNTGRTDQTKWFVGVEFWNVSDYNNPSVRDGITNVWASFNGNTKVSDCFNNFGVVPNCGCSYTDPNGNGVLNVGEIITVYCWMNASYWPVTSGNRRIMFWVHEMDTGQDANGNGALGEWWNDALSKREPAMPRVNVTPVPPPTYILTFNAFVDVLPTNYYMTSAPVKLDSTIKSTDLSGSAQFTNLLGNSNHGLSVYATTGGRTFSHFWDSDCDQTTPGMSDDEEGLISSPPWVNNFWFTMYNRNRKNVTAYYRAYTKIVDYSTGSPGFNLNSTHIFGRLLNEIGNPLADSGFYHNGCTAFVSSRNINHDVALDYYNGSHWIPLATSVIATEGNWSYPWTCGTTGALQLRTNYTPTTENWYYDSTNQIISTSCLPTCAYLTGGPGGCMSVHLCEVIGGGTCEDSADCSCCCM